MEISDSGFFFSIFKNIVYETIFWRQPFISTTSCCGRFPGEGNGNPLTVLLPGESHGQRSLAYSPWGRKESDWASLVAQTVKPLSAMLETWVQSLGQEDLLEKEMATHSSTLAWKISWTEEPGRLQSVGLQRAGHDWATLLTYLLTYIMLQIFPPSEPFFFWFCLHLWCSSFLILCSRIYQSSTVVYGFS